MKRIGMILLAALLLFTVLSYAAPIGEDAQTCEELRSKWEALTDRQRHGIYKLFGKRGRAEIELMNEYARLGLVTEEEAESFAERVASWLDALEQSGDLPPVYGHVGHKKGAHTPCRPAPDAQTPESAAS